MEKRRLEFYGGAMFTHNGHAKAEKAILEQTSRHLKGRRDSGLMDAAREPIELDKDMASTYQVSICLTVVRLSDTPIAGVRRPISRTFALHGADTSSKRLLKDTILLERADVLAVMREVFEGFLTETEIDICADVYFTEIVGVSLYQRR
jgi:hypothetical protein